MVEHIRMVCWFSAQRWNYWPCCCLAQIKSNYQHHMKHHQKVRNRGKHLQHWLGVETPRIKPRDQTKQRTELSLPPQIPQGAPCVQPQGGLFCYSSKRAWKIFSSFSRPAKFPLLFLLRLKSKLTVSILGLFNKTLCPCFCAQVFRSKQEPSPAEGQDHVGLMETIKARFLTMEALGVVCCKKADSDVLPPPKKLCNGQPPRNASTLVEPAF